MPEAFRPLAELIRSTIEPAADPAARQRTGDVPEYESPSEEIDRTVNHVVEDALRDVRLFRAAMSETVENAIETLLADIAAHVLARELQLAPADVGAIVHSALARYFEEQPLRVHVHPEEAPLVRCTLPVAPDDRLRKGDAMIELRCGSIDARLGTRLEVVLENLR